MLGFHTRVTEFRRVCSEFLGKGRQRVVSWRTTGREWIPVLGDSRGVGCLGMVTLTERLVGSLGFDGAVFDGFS